MSHGTVLALELLAETFVDAVIEARARPNVTFLRVVMVLSFNGATQLLVRLDEIFALESDDGRRCDHCHSLRT